MARDNFHHPFEPYDIQKELMQAVYDCISDGKVGIFESPTGTGKSLSLICASLTWLRDYKRKTFDAALQKIELDDDDEPAWMVEHARKSFLENAQQLRSEYEARLAHVREAEAKVRKQKHPAAFPQKRSRKEQEEHDTEETFMLDDYVSDGETNSVTRRDTAYSAETEEMLRQMGMLQQKDTTGQSTAVSEENVKVYICSRTHSQLAQFVGELQRISLPSGIPTTDVSNTESIKLLSMGSRKNLCINPNVRKLGSQTAINEKCLDLQSPGKGNQRCSFALQHDRPEQLLEFRDRAIAQVRDIEELADVGRELKVCPYYGSRSALAPAEVVLLPYPLLLQRTAREAMGISLKGCVIIVDEAHNLIDAVQATHSSEISDKQLRTARNALMTYLQKFRARLKGSNRTYIAQVIRVIDSLLGAMQSFSGAAGVTTPSALLSGKNVDQINLDKLSRYISNSKLARKVEGYAKFVQHAADEDLKSRDETATTVETPILTLVQNFLTTVSNPSAEGRFFWERFPSGVTLRYMLLDPSQHFRDIVEDARAVILAGGTMSPMQDQTTQLFPYLADVRTLSCGHIVPASSIFVRAIAGDLTGTFEYTFKTRADVSLVRRTGSQLIRIAKIVQGGMVIFFASYAYLELVQKQWEKDGTLDQLRQLKATFFDGRDRPADTTFQHYKDAVHSHAGGALLFSVIGGKLSEGINFSDELGRCVVVVGMPYPNLSTPEWQAKLEHLSSRANVDSHTSHQEVSREYAENICMRAVNQAVGRAIRHKNDWASILLIDARYSRPRIQNKLPNWIKASLAVPHPSIHITDRTWEDDLQRFFSQTR